MQTEILVNYGRPILKLRYTTLKYLAILIISVGVANILYCLYLIMYAIQVKRHVGDFVSMVNNDGWVLPVGIVVPALLGLAVTLISLVLLFKIFRIQDRKQMALNSLLFTFILIFFVVILVNLIIAIILLSHSYGSHLSLHDGITEAMANYGLESQFKTTIDVLQVEFQCCGSKKYNEWFDLVWYDVNLINNSTKISGGEAPFSCCAIHTSYPCIHHGIDSAGSAYLYSPDANFSISKHGCHSMIRKRKKSVSWKIFLLINLLGIVLIILAACLRIIQTAHYDRGKFVRGFYVYTAWIIGKYVGKKRTATAPPVPPASPELLE